MTGKSSKSDEEKGTFSSACVLISERYNRYPSAVMGLINPRFDRRPVSVSQERLLF
jgi:hypothetical protein